MENKANEIELPGLAWTYEGPLGILDDDTIFCNEISSYSDYYELLLNQDGSRNVPDKKALLKKLKNIENIVQLRVFCYEFKKVMSVTTAIVKLRLQPLYRIVVVDCVQ